jgi:hypothetical protein
VAGQAFQRRPSRFQSTISPRDSLSRPVLRISTAAHQIPDYDGPRENARAISTAVSNVATTQPRSQA